MLEQPAYRVRVTYAAEGRVLEGATRYGGGWGAGARGVVCTIRLPLPVKISHSKPVSGGFADAVELSTAHHPYLSLACLLSRQYALPKSDNPCRMLAPICTAQVRQSLPHAGGVVCAHSSSACLIGSCVLAACLLNRL
eukprot:365272-Chlamydomonas_euryale.AAC.8